MSVSLTTKVTSAFAIVALCVALAGCGGRAHAQSTFSAASLNGSYAGIFFGNIKSGTEFLPFVGTGIFVANGTGGLSGHESFTVNGTPCTATISGSYTVNPDGSGSLSAAFTSSGGTGCVSGTYTQDLAIAQGGKLVVLSNTNGDEIHETWTLQSS